MSNPVSFSDRQTDYKNGVRYTAGISVDASASYVRDGSKVIITVRATAIRKSTSHLLLMGPRRQVRPTQQLLRNRMYPIQMPLGQELTLMMTLQPKPILSI